MDKPSAAPWPPRCWIHWNEHPKQGAAKLYASPSGPSNKTNPNWKPFEYVSLEEHQALLSQAIAERDEYRDALDKARDLIEDALIETDWDCVGEACGTIVEALADGCAEGKV